MSSHNVSHLLRFFCISLLFASCNLYQSVDEVDSDEPQVDATFDVTSDAGSDQSEADVATIDMPSSDVPPDMTEQRWMPPGPTYFVATDGDDSNDGSIDAPWQTFAFATSNLVANDTLFIRGGDYTEQLNINVIGFPDEPIHIRAYEDEAVVIHEIDTPLLIQNTRSVHLYGITLGDAFINWGLIDDSNNVILENVTAMVTRPTPAATTSHEGFTIESSDFVTLRNVNFAGWGFRDDASRDGHNLTISQCDYVLVEDSYFGDSASSSLELVTSTHLMVRRNVVESPSTTCLLYLNTTGFIIDNEVRLCGSSGIGIDRTLSDVVIRNNIVWGSNVGLSITGNPNTTIEEYRVFNNTFVLNDSEGVVINDEDQLGIDFVNIELKNNIIARNRVNTALQRQLYVNDFQNPAFGDIRFENNLFTNLNAALCSANLQAGPDGGGECPLHVEGVGNGDVAWMQQQPIVQFTANVEGDPRFRSVRPVVGEIDLNLEQNSPALDAGVPLTTAVGSETSNKMVVVDASYFHDDLLGLVEGDTILIGTQTAVVTFVDLPLNELTLDRDVTYSDGDPVTLPYSGTGIDLGALESPL